MLLKIIAKLFPGESRILIVANPKAKKKEGKPKQIVPNQKKKVKR